jgi:repressor LexA
MQGLTDRQQQVLHYIRQSISERGYPPTLREIGAHMGIRSTNGVNDHLRALERKGYLTREDMKSRALRPVALKPGLHGLPSVPGGYSGGGEAGDGRSADGRSGEGERPRLAAVPNLPNDRGGNDVAHGSSSNAALSLAVGGSDDIIEIPVLGRIAAGMPLLAEEHVLDTVRIEKGLVRGGKEVFGLRVTGDSMIEAGIFSGDYIFVRKQPTAQRGEIVVALIGDEATVKYYYPEKDYVRFQPANAQMAPILVRAADFRPTMLLGVVVGVYRKL